MTNKCLEHFFKPTLCFFNVFKVGRSSSPFIFVFSINAIERDNLFEKIADEEVLSTDLWVETDRSANCSTTTLHIFSLLCHKLHSWAFIFGGNQ